MKSILLIATTLLMASSAFAQYEYKGWRNDTDFTGGSGVENAARAKLHACSTTGKTQETAWATLSKCTSPSLHTANDYCEDATWDTLCAGWLVR